MALKFLSSGDIDGEFKIEVAGPKLQLKPTTQNNASVIELGVLNAGTNAYAKIDAINLQNYDTNLRFWTNAAGSTTQVERMRIATNLITFPTITELRGDIGSAKFAVGNMGDASSQMMVSSRGFLTFNVSNTGSALDAVERLRITDTGAFSVGSTGTNYGSSGQVLTSGGNSNPTWTTPTTGTVTGSGTANKVTKFTGATSIGDGPITFATNDSTFAGNVTAATVLNINRDAGSTNDRLTITSADIVTTIERVENTGDANAGYGRIDFKTNAATGGTAGRSGFKFIDGDGNNILYLENNDSSATFAGSVEIRSGNKLILQRPNNGVATEISTDSTGAMILNSINDEGFFFNNNGTNAFKLDPINATFAGNITSTATSFVQTFNVTDNSTFFNINHVGNEAWLFKCESIGGGTADFITIGASGGGKVAFGEDGGAIFEGIITCNNVGNDRKIEFNRTGANVYSIEHDSAFLYFYNVTANSIPLKLANNNDATFAGDVYSSGTSNSLVVISRDNMFVDGGQFYIGADDGTTDDSFRQRTASGSYFIESRKSGTWTNRLQINTAGTLIAGQGATFAGSVDCNTLLSVSYSDISTGENRGLRIINTSGTDQQWNITAGITGQENESFCIRDATANVNALTMAISSGNAVFAGTVTANGIVNIGGIGVAASGALANVDINDTDTNGTSTSYQPNITFKAAGVLKAQIGKLSGSTNYFTAAKNFDGPVNIIANDVHSGHTHAAEYIFGYEPANNQTTWGLNLVDNSTTSNSLYISAEGLSNNSSIFFGGYTNALLVTRISLNQTLGTWLYDCPDAGTSNVSVKWRKYNIGGYMANMIDFEDDGDIKNINGSYGTISSDERVKENVVEATSKLDDILSLKVKNFNFIGDNKKQIGLIAQEVEEVFPSWVNTRDTRIYKTHDEHGVPLEEQGELVSGYEDGKGLKVGMEFAVLVKTIQELNAKIVALESRINEM